MCDECEALKRRVKDLENALDDAIEFLNDQADCRRFFSPFTAVPSDMIQRKRGA